MNNRVLESITRDRELMRELVDWLPEGTLVAPEQPESTAELDEESVRAAAENELRRKLEHDRGLEAIVERYGRPSLLVSGRSFEPPASGRWRHRLTQSKDRLGASFASVGRVELIGTASPFIGTAWMIGPDVAVTNRHVAEVFASQTGGRYEFLPGPWGEPFQVRVDFLEEHGVEGSAEVRVREVLYLADPAAGEPDVAFLRLDSDDDHPLPQPISPFQGRLESGMEVANIGYPAFDDRNDRSDMARIFKGIYGAKRLAPGVLTRVVSSRLIAHDCTTLGGSSGSVLLDLDSCEAVGLHFSGKYREANLAVDVGTVMDLYERTCGTGGGRPAASVNVGDSPRAQPAGEAGELDKRTGYDPDFLDDFRVPLPEFDSGLAATLANEDEGNELRYTHFSVIMHAERRLAWFTAVNIDGSRIVRIKRGRDRWSHDPRLESTHQLGNKLYKHNPLDRGHLVRRLDPAWGPESEAKQAVEDTFFWTNCSPQHSGINQKTWLSLETYLLDSADTHGFRACIFTGPIYRDDDPSYRDLTQIPRSFWKVAVMRCTDDLRLTATAYIVSQARLLTDLEFSYGAYRTYQVPVSLVENQTGLVFGELSDQDPLRAFESTPYKELRGPRDIRLL